GGVGGRGGWSQVPGRVDAAAPVTGPGNCHVPRGTPTTPGSDRAFSFPELSSMQVSRLVVRDLRRFEHAELTPAPGLNLLTGSNGAGKSSVLEALHLMAYGRSFRGRVRDGLVREGAEALEVFVEWAEQGPSGRRTRQAGLR